MRSVLLGQKWRRGCGRFLRIWWGEGSVGDADFFGNRMALALRFFCFWVLRFLLRGRGCGGNFFIMSIAGSMSAAAAYQSMSTRSAQVAQEMRDAAMQQRAQVQQASARAVKAQSAQAVRQSPRAESSVMQTSRDVRQLVARSMRDESNDVRVENRRRTEEQQAAYAREMARRSEYIRKEGNTIRENFRAIA